LIQAVINLLWALSVERRYVQIYNRGTSTRPSCSLSYCTPHRHGGVIPAPAARPTSNVSKQLHLGLRRAIRLKSLLTWMTIFLRTYWTILVMFCININYFKTALNILTISLRPRRHSLSLTVKTNCNKIINRLLFKKTFISFLTFCSWLRFVSYVIKEIMMMTMR